jgi:hypothetical protein
MFDDRKDKQDGRNCMDCVSSKSTLSWDKRSRKEKWRLRCSTRMPPWDVSYRQETGYVKWHLNKVSNRGTCPTYGPRCGATSLTEKMSPRPRRLAMPRGRCPLRFIHTLPSGAISNFEVFSPFVAHHENTSVLASRERRKTSQSYEKKKINFLLFTWLASRWI